MHELCLLCFVLKKHCLAGISRTTYMYLLATCDIYKLNGILTTHYYLYFSQGRQSRKLLGLGSEPPHRVPVASTLGG